MTDTSTGLGSIQSWISSVNQAFASLPQTINQDAQIGDFSSILTSLQSVLDPASSTTTSSAASAEVTGQQSLLSTALSSSTVSDDEAASATPSSIVQGAEQYLGTPYVWGGSAPGGFDCSGLVQYVYGQQGIALPRTAAEQAQVGTPVASLADAQPGDLVFFPGSDGTASSPGHVGIYLGGGQMIDAPETGETVSIQPVGDPTEIRRILSTSSATLASGGSGSTVTDLAPTSGATGMTSSNLAGVPESLVPLFQSSAAKYGVPATLLEAVAQTESGFNPNAVSAAGAEGLMQFMPGTAAGLGIDPYDPAEAIDGAAQLLSSYLATYKSTPDALAAYNAGPAAVAQYGGVPPYAQTQQYVQTIMNQIGASS